MKKPRIDVLHVTPVQQGRLLALASVRIGPFTIRRLRLVADPLHGMALQGPQLVRDINGVRDYSTLVQFAHPMRTAIRDAVLEAYRSQQSQEGGLPL